MDTISKEQRSELMSRVGGKNTSPERLVRRLLHRRGYRFGLHANTLPGTPDLFLRKYGVLIFVDGCFWHGHNKCPLYRPPKTGKKFWSEKIERNRNRDMAIDRKLLALGWRVLHVWECALHSKCRLSEATLVDRIEAFIHGEGKLKNIRGRKI
jgi:DNA mismatch endonuclease (patch repair protein)